MAVLVVLAMMGVGIASAAAESRGVPVKVTENTELDKRVGQSVDIAPWAYAWRADLPEQERRSIHYRMPELLEPLLPPPQGSPCSRHETPNWKTDCLNAEWRVRQSTRCWR